MHSVFALWNLLMGLGHGLRLLAPASADWLGGLVMLATLGAWIPMLWVSPAIIVISIYYWRDWSVLLLGLLLAMYVIALQDMESGSFYIAASVYTVCAVPLCAHWFFRRRRTW